MGRINTTNAKEAGLKTVGSSAGFSAGDLVYQTASDTGIIPASYTGGTGTFNAKGKKPVAKMTDTTYYSKTLVPLNGGWFVNGTPAATLSNGNVVTIYCRRQDVTGPEWNNSSTSYKDIYFRIDQPDGTNVVAETRINAAATASRVGSTYVVACVAASSSGGFAVCWNNYESSQKMLFKGFNNDGTANGNETQLTTRTYNFAMTASPSGKYFIGSQDVTSNLSRYTKIDADGTNIVTATSSAMQITYLTDLDVTCTSDNVFQFVFLNAGNQCRRWRVSDDGTEIANDIPFTGTDIYHTPRIETKSDNLAVLSYIKDGAGSTWSLAVRIEDSLNSWSEEILLDFEMSSDIRYTQAALGKIGTDQFYCTHSQYEKTVAAAFDANGALLGGINIGSGVTDTGVGARTVILVGSEARVYCSNGYHDFLSTMNMGNRVFGNFGYYKLDVNYLEAGGNESPEINIATITSDIDAYDKSVSTPVKAGFFAKNSLSELVTSARTTGNDSLVLPQTAIEQSDESRTKIRGLELDDGKILIGYTIDNVAGAKIIILNDDYSENRTFTITESRRGAFNYPFDIERLNDGTIIIGYLKDGTNDYYARKYNAQMVEIIGETLLVSNVDNDSMGNLAAVVNNTAAFVLGYVNTSGAASYRSFRDNLTTIATATMTGTASREVQILEVGDNTLHLLSRQTGSGQWYTYYRIDSSGNGNYGDGAGLLNYLNTSYGRLNFKPFKSAGGESHFLSTSSGTNYATRIYGTPNTQQQTYSNIGPAYSNDWGALYGRTGNGIPFFYFQTPSYTQPNELFVQRYDDGNFAIRAIDNLGLSLRTTTEPSGFIIPSAGPTAHILVCDSSNDLTISKVRLVDEYAPITLTAGTTKAEPVDVLSSKAAFLGVAATNCPANGTGLVQAKGAAVLSNDYPADTAQTNFDFRQPTTEGVSGSINGRNVTIGE